MLHTGLALILRSYMVKGENGLPKLSSDFHTCVMHTCSGTHTERTHTERGRERVNSYKGNTQMIMILSVLQCQLFGLPFHGGLMTLVKSVVPKKPAQVKGGKRRDEKLSLCNST